MDSGRLVRIVFYVAWGVPGVPVFIADVMVMFWHPTPLVAALQAIVAASLLLIPYTVWRYAGGRTHAARERARAFANDAGSPRPFWQRSPYELAFAGGAAFVRVRFALTCGLAVLAVVSLALGAGAQSLHLLTK